jgi:hypothetical protein
MMEAVRTFETPVDNHFTRQYNPEDSSEHHARRRENLKSHIVKLHFRFFRNQPDSKYVIIIQKPNTKWKIVPNLHHIRNATWCLLQILHMEQ